MNATAPTPNEHPVTVTLSDCSDDDAHRVLTHLATEFTDRSPGQETPGGEHTRATVWTAEFDVTPTGSARAATARADGLDGSVCLTAQGAPHDVTTVRTALAEAYTVRDAGSVSGDQERECQYQLTSAR
ncbi:hypothetical protein [Streptomyces sp. NPDC046939]|uniref:hypothetical protein n=1 Tax=Streptomyces sp. NPDC046939 TaxID=3155376 RepID=UPI0033D92914